MPGPRAELLTSGIQVRKPYRYISRLNCRALVPRDERHIPTGAFFPIYTDFVLNLVGNEHKANMEHRYMLVELSACCSHTKMRFLFGIVSSLVFLKSGSILPGHVTPSRKILLLKNGSSPSTDTFVE